MMKTSSQVYGIIKDLPLYIFHNSFFPFFYPRLRRHEDHAVEHRDRAEDQELGRPQRRRGRSLPQASGQQHLRDRLRGSNHPTVGSEDGLCAADVLGTRGRRQLSMLSSRRIQLCDLLGGQDLQALGFEI